QPKFLLVSQSGATMKLKSNHWYSIPRQNLAIFMREAGFDLAVYDLYSNSVKTEARKHAIDAAAKSLAEGFEAQVTNRRFVDIRKGVYVITLSSPFTLAYDRSASPVIYIGIGHI